LVFSGQRGGLEGRGAEIVTEYTRVEDYEATTMSGRMQRMIWQQASRQDMMWRTLDESKKGEHRRSAEVPEIGREA
jgi:hypothetical protein